MKLFWVSLHTILFAVVANCQCYYPDGSAANDTACFPQNAVSFCCGYGYACLENQICSATSSVQSSNPSLIRGSCTDSTWKSSACPQFCLNAVDSEHQPSASV